MNAHRIKLDIPANTLEIDAVSDTIKLEHGILRKLEIAFPDGCADLVHARVMDGLRPVAPANEGSWFAWNDFTIDYDPFYVLDDQPFEITVEGWNEDIYIDKYVIFRFYVDPRDPQADPNWIKKITGIIPFGR